MQEYNQFEQDAMIIDSEPVYNRATRRQSERGYHSFADKIKTYFLFSAGTVTVIIVGWGLIEVRQFIPLVGLLALLVAIVLLLCACAWAVIAVVRYATRAEFYPIEESGAYLRDSLGRIQPLAPMVAAPARVNKATAKIEITPVVPTLFDLIENGDIAPGEMTMVMGYDKAQLDKGILQLVMGAWPGTHAVAGKGRSGKTRRVIAEVAQALIAGARVIICDPHFSKLDSLARSLEPLEKHLTIARGEEQIVSIAQEFLSEMEARVDDPGRACSPWLIIFDEWSRLMDENNVKMPEGGRDILVDVAKNCSTQYAGYLGYCCLIGQIWTNEHVGGTDIRRSLQSVFLHQLSGEYAAFFFRAAKWKNRAEELKKRECIYRDTENQVMEVVTIGVPDDTAARVAVYLASLGVPAIDAPASVQTPRFPEYQETPRLQQPTYTPYLLAAPAPRQNAQDLEPLPPLTSNGANYQVERDETLPTMEAGYGSAQEAPRKRPGSDAEVQTEALRAIAKRLRAGESANTIRKSLGITGGRAMQEVNAALNALGDTQSEQ